MNKQDEEKAKSYGLSNDLEENFHGELEEAFLSGCEWKEQQMIEKAIKFIDENTFGMLDNGVPYIQSIHDTSKNEFIKDLKKYMEEN